MTAPQPGPEPTQGADAVGGSADGVVCEVTDLHLSFPDGEFAPIAALRGVNLQLRLGRTVGVVGESGSGKSMLGLTLLGLSPEVGDLSGEVLLEGVDMIRAPERIRRRQRRKSTGLILQDPGTAMNPVRKIKAQMREAIAGTESDGPQRAQRITEALEAVGLDPDRVLDRYPFQLSGGMQQRVVIAMAVARQPALLIADEPTTALDVTTQVSVLALIARLKEEVRPAVLFVSHDLSVIRQVADEVVVLYGGRVFERGPVAQVIGAPHQPYTQALTAAIPRLDSRGADLVSLPGYPEPSRVDDPGCPFRSRCPRAIEKCASDFPEPIQVDDEHWISCWNPTQGRSEHAESA